jgi:hypothetical protein
MGRSKGLDQRVWICDPTLMDLEFMTVIHIDLTRSCVVKARRRRDRERAASAYIVSKRTITCHLVAVGEDTDEDDAFKVKSVQQVSRTLLRRH